MTADRRNQIRYDQAAERLLRTDPRSCSFAELRQLAPHIPAFVAERSEHPNEIGQVKSILKYALMQNPAAADIVRSLITDPHELVRATAIGAAGWAGEAGLPCGALIYAALKDPAQTVRSEAEKALGRIKWETAWRDLDRAAGQEGDAGLSGLTALSALKTINSIPALEDALRGSTIGDDHWHAAVVGLAGLGPRARGSLELLVPILTHPDPHVRGRALYACYRIDPTEKRLEALVGHYRAQLSAAPPGELAPMTGASPLHRDIIGLLDVFTELELRDPQVDLLLLDIFERRHIPLHYPALNLIEELGASPTVKDRILGPTLQLYGDMLDEIDLQASGAPPFATGASEIARAMMLTASLYPGEARVQAHIDRIRGLGVYLYSSYDEDRLADTVVAIDRRIEGSS